MFSCEFIEIFNNIFYRTLPVAASVLSNSEKKLLAKYSENTVESGTFVCLFPCLFFSMDMLATHLTFDLKRS